MNKWLKYQVLKKIGLLTSEEENNIRRYTIKNRFDLSRDIAEYLENQEGEKLLIVVKFVEIGVTYGLKNFRITSIFDLQHLNSLLKDEINIMEYSEIWWCQSSLEYNSGNYAGRFSSNLRYLKNNTPYGNLEILIGKSPRELNVSAPDITLGLSWTQFIAGEFTLVNYRESKSNARQLYSNVIEDLSKAIPYHSKGLEVLWNAFETLGLSTVSIEFKRTSSRLEIIDFDTEADNYVIDYFGFNNSL